MKTTLGNNLLKEFNYDIIEFNASDIRNQKLVKEHFKNIIGKVSITIWVAQDIMVLLWMKLMG